MDVVERLAELPPDERAHRLRGIFAEDEALARRVQTLLTEPNCDEAATTPLDESHEQSATTAGQAPLSIGPYHLVSLIGEGGMGQVFKAEQRSPVRRVVALKLIKLGMDTASVVARFQAERQALAMMDHPNVARVYDAGAAENGRPYFVMEYVAGEAITRYCDRHNLRIRDRLELFIDVCDAVQHAHQKGIIHRDIKPSNVLVSVRDGGKPTPKVIDFGVAKATSQRLAERTLFTEHGQLIGTPEYMSPEQAEMGALDIDTRSDVYSLGVLLYELLTGCLPFDAAMLRRAAFGEIQRIIREVEPPRPSTRVSSLEAGIAADVVRRRSTAVEALRVELKRELEWIPLKAMRKDRTQRYRTASELADDIGAYLENRPLLAGPESAAYRFRKLLRRNKGPVAAATAVLLVLVAGTVGTTIGLIGQAKQRALAEQRRLEAERQESDAKQQAAISEATNAFLAEMLSSADPEKLLGDNVTVLQAVRAAVKQLDAGSLKNQPLVEASIRRTIGDTLASLGRYDEALPNLREALRRRQAALPANHRNTATSLINVASVLQAQGNYPDAELLCRDALQIYRKALPAESEEIATALIQLALSLQGAGRPAEAEPLFREAVEIYRKAMPAGHPHIAASVMNLASLLQAQGNLPEAEPLHREALEIYRRALPAGHPTIASSLNHVASVMLAQGKFSEAEPLFREALEIYRKALPAEHPYLAAGRRNLAAVLHELGQHTEAEHLLREALAMYRRSLPAGHADIATSLNNLAASLQVQGKLAEAELLHREALEACQKALPPGHPQIASTMHNLASLLQAQGKLAEAESVFREALEIGRKGLPAGHPQIAVNLFGLSVLLQSQGKLAEAEPLLREALDINRKALPAGHPDITSILSYLAKLLEAQGKPVDAEPLLREALELRRKALPAAHPEIAASLMGLASLLQTLGKLDEAEPLYQEALEIRRKSLPAGHPHIATSLKYLASLRTAQGNLSEAEQLHREVLEMDRKSLPAGHPDIATSLSQLAYVLRGEGKLAEAELLLREALGIVRAALPAQHPDIAHILNNLAVLLRDRGNVAEAERLFREALEIRNAKFGVSGRPTTQAAAGLAEVLEATNRQDEAAALRRKFKLDVSTTQPTTDPRTTSSTPTNAPATQTGGGPE